MPHLQEKAVTVLASLTGVSLNVAGKQTLYTTPTGKTGHIVAVVLKNPSASAAAADATFGGNASADDFVGATQFDNLVASDDCIRVEPASGGTPAGFKRYSAGVAFGMDVGTQASVTVDVDVLGYLT